jgi:hypothetical protein
MRYRDTIADKLARVTPTWIATVSLSAVITSVLLGLIAWQRHTGSIMALALADAWVSGLYAAWWWIRVDR